MKKIFIIASSKKRQLYSSFLDDLKSKFEIIQDPKKIENDSLLVVMGGDGTLNFLVNNLPEKIKIETLRVIYFALGTANDFAKSLRLPETEPSLQLVLDIIRGSSLINVPICKCNTRHFINAASFGSPARVTSSAATKLKEITGKFSYYLNALEETFSDLEYKVHVECGEKKKEFKTKGFIISQGAYVGGGVRITTSMVPNFTEELNFVSIDSTDLSKILKFVSELQKETSNAYGDSCINLFEDEFKIKVDKEVEVKLDGEKYSAKEFHVMKTNSKLHFYNY
jgi:diacylglycerol kinase family enzyme